MAKPVGGDLHAAPVALVFQWSRVDGDLHSRVIVEKVGAHEPKTLMR